MATRTAKGFTVICPFCGDAESTVKLDLNDLKACVCTSCDEEFTPAEARDKASELLARWDAVCRWVDLAADVIA